MKKFAEDIIREEINAIKAIPMTGINEAVEAIVSCDGKLVLTGMGKAGKSSKPAG